MPMPKKKKGESKEKFIERFMKDPTMLKEYPEEKQRYAIALKTFEDEDCKKKDSVHRVDFFDFPYALENEDSNYLETKFRKTDEGYLQGRAVVTNIGVFTYMLSDGTVRRELRTPEEVMDNSSLESLRMKPLTNNHPIELVNQENIKEYQVGNLGDEVRADSFKVSIPINITDKDAIADVENGKRSLSCGYTADIVDESGVWMGVQYDAKQTNIRYNHVALVDRGRAGDAVKIKMDSAGDVGFQVDVPEKDMEEKMKSIKIDGVDYEAEAQVIAAYNQTQTKLDTVSEELESKNEELKTLKADSDKIEAERDAMKERVDALEKELAEKKFDEADLRKAVDEKLVLLDAAKLAKIEVKEDMSNEDIKKAVIISVSENAKLDGKSSDYIDARFDAAMETLKAEDKADSDQRETINDSTEEQIEVKIDSTEARAKYVELMKNGGKE